MCDVRCAMCDVRCAIIHEHTHFVKLLYMENFCGEPGNIIALKNHGGM